MRRGLAFALFALVGAVTACSEVRGPDVVRLLGLSPRTIDPAKLELGVRVPDWLGTGGEFADLRISFSHDLKGIDINETFQLERIASDEDRGPPALRKRGHRASIFRLAAADVPRMATVRDVLSNAWGREGRSDVDVEFSVSLCLMGEIPASGALTMEFFARPFAEAPFVPAIKKQSSEITQDLRDGLTPCPRVFASDDVSGRVAP